MNGNRHGKGELVKSDGEVNLLVAALHTLFSNIIIMYDYETVRDSQP